ncbi:MAG TPA: SRPBCC family protein [Actinomycetota bacterium]|nr:SRPBCC family protein [Actinomycetota bacterium]
MTARARIAAPPEAVFDFIDNWQNAMRYLKRVDKWVLTSPEGGTGPGAVFDIGVQAGPTHLDGRLKVTEHERPRTIAFRSMDGPRVEGRWTLTPDGDGTAVVLHASYELPGGIIGRVVGSFVGRNAQNDLNQSLAELKRLVESGA